MNLQVQPANDKQQRNSRFSQAISLLQRKHYGCLSKIFCCKCFYCCQDFDFTLLTSKNRKGVFQKMVKKYLKSMHNTNQPKTNIIMDPFFILMALLLGQESAIYNQLLQQFSNANQSTILSKQDLEFYIPQLCTYLVFHEQMSNIQLLTLLQRACKIDLHFSLRYYFFMKSLQIIDSTYQVRKLPIVQKYNNSFRNKINLCHKVSPLKKQSHKRKESFQKRIYSQSADDKQISHDNMVQQLKQIRKQSAELQSQKQKKQRKDSYTSQAYSQDTDECNDWNDQNDKVIQICKAYNSQGKESINFSPKVNKLHLEQIYQSFINKPTQNYPKGLFQSTTNFFFDLVGLSELLLKIQNGITQSFQNYLYDINKRLPAAVYIPFTKNEYHGLNIVNIVVKQCRIFKTKERVPVKICFETFYNPNTSEQLGRQKKIRSTIRSGQNLKRSVLFQQDIILEIDPQSQPQQKKTPDISTGWLNKSSMNQKEQMAFNDSTGKLSEANKIKINFKAIKKNIWQKVFELKKLIIENDNSKDSKSERKNSDANLSTEKDNSKIQDMNNGQNLSNFSDVNNSKKLGEQQNRILNQLKQSQKQQETMSYEGSQRQEDQYKLFGYSQKSKFQSIALKSPYSRLSGYKIISLMIKSNDDLRQQCFALQLLQEFQKIFKMQKLKIKLCPYEIMPLSHNSGIIQYISQAITIDELIKKQGSLLFVRKNKEKLKNFIRSLTGYSLVTYMLQVKDRHNQNIMIKRNGTLVHIDFGFFLSSMPGKGVQLEKKVPFKLTHEYIDALGGVKSEQFGQFRKLFYQGFNALRKHQHRILILTKLMYSSYGTSMRCFEKGDEAIQKFVSRFNPKNVHTDVQLSLFCQNLINSSLQNWRAKWYDRWQYFAQGILY